MISTRTFFKTGKFRSRKENPPQDLTTSLYTSRNASIDTTNTSSSLWTTPIKHIPILKKNPAVIQNQSTLDSDVLSHSARKSNDTMREPVKVIPPFEGLPTTQSTSSGLLDDDEYRALGLRTPDIQRAQIFQNGSRGGSPRLPAEKEAVQEMFEMDVPTQVSRGNRPDLQVRIPANTPPSRSPGLLSARNGGPTPLSAMSTPSSLPTGRVMKSANTATPYSMVSPLTGVEMPKPRRPFSTESIEGVAKQGTPVSQQRTDGRYQVKGRSRKTSVSSEYETETPKPGHTPVLQGATSSHFDSGNLYHNSLEPNSTGQKKSVTINAPTIHRKVSAMSVSSNVNVNKPLPPEPPAVAARYESPSTPLRHIAYSTSPSAPRVQQIPSRSNSTIKQPSRTQNNEPPSPETNRVGFSDVKRRGSQSSLARSTTLRSKYTPKDLDSMDEAFQRGTNSNSAYQTPIQSRSRASPSESQASLTDLGFLSTITENSPRSSHAVGLSHEPTRISRGPMRMEPSRRPPPHPTQPLRIHTIELDKVGKKKQTILRSQSNNSINTMNTSDAEKDNRKRPTVSRTQSNTSINAAQQSPRKKSMNTEHHNANRRNHERQNSDQQSIDHSASEWPSVESVSKERKTLERTNTERVSKADRVLGLTGTSAVGRQTYDARPQTKEAVRVAKAYRDDSEDEDFYEIRGIQDAHFEEIENRLKLLSPKEDPSAAFDAFHQANVNRQSRPTDKLASEEESKQEAKPTIEEKLHLSGTLQGNPIVPSFIAELEAHRAPSPVELHGSDTHVPALNVVHEVEQESGIPELGVPSPNASTSTVAPLQASTQPHRRGRSGSSNPMSLASGKTKSLHSNRSARVRSLASIAASDIPDFYVNSPTPNTNSKRPSVAGSEYEEVITADAAEQVLLHILQSLDNLEDLFAAALVSKGFYRTFKRHELYLLKHAIWKMSPAAWELREMSIPYAELDSDASDYTAALYFRYYVQDLLTMVELKAMILESCKSFLRPETISGLAGETTRSSMIDEAFWRVWTFCRIFGCGNKREDDIVGQMDWLRGGVIANQSSDTRTLALTDELARNSVLFNPPPGFAKGNGKRGLTVEELHDMIEIWTCLGVLVRGYHGQRKNARDFGVYDRCDVEIGDTVHENAMLEEWTHHLLALAPSTVLDVFSPATPTRTQFAQARSQGYTKWTPPKKGMSRSTFLKEAVSRVYEEKMSQRRPAKYSALPYVHPSIGADAAIAAKARIARHAAEIRKQKEDPSYRNVPVSDDRPLSNYSDVLDRLEAISAATDAPPMPKLPGLAARLSRAKSRGNSAVAEATMAVRPSSPSSTVDSSAISIQNSFSTGPDNHSAADLNSSTSSTKATKSKRKHPFQRKAEDSSPAPSPSKAGLGRFSTLRGHKLLDKAKNKKEKTPPSASAAASVEEVSSVTTPVTQTPATMAIASSDEKFAVLPEDTVNTVPQYRPQVRDPVDLAVERLVKMGFEEDKAKKVLAQTETGNGINFDAALSRLKKERERRKRLERLETMG